MNRFLTRPLYLQLRDALVERIARGQWKPGAAVPNEQDLAREFGVSPGTMRKALDLMESMRASSRAVLAAAPSLMTRPRRSWLTATTRFVGPTAQAFPTTLRAERSPRRRRTTRSVSDCGSRRTIMSIDSTGEGSRVVVPTWLKTCPCQRQCFRD